MNKQTKQLPWNKNFRKMTHRNASDDFQVGTPSVKGSFEQVIGQRETRFDQKASSAPASSPINNKGQIRKKDWKGPPPPIAPKPKKYIQPIKCRETNASKDDYAVNVETGFNESTLTGNIEEIPQVSSTRHNSVVDGNVRTKARGFMKIIDKVRREDEDRKSLHNSDKRGSYLRGTKKQGSPDATEIKSCKQILENKEILNKDLNNESPSRKDNQQTLVNYSVINNNLGLTLTCEVERILDIDHQIFYGWHEDESPRDCSKTEVLWKADDRKTGVVYGNGAYFARDSKYSLNYCQPGHNGNRHIYVARVLVGKFTTGKRGMKAPPPRNDPRNPGLLYDSVVDDTENPTIFVIFNDHQCYPEFLITFR